jgi:hypothetical protein
MIVWILLPARMVLHVELVLALIMTAVFWLPDFNRIFALALIIPVLIARVLVRRHVWTHTPLDFAMLILVALGLINGLNAPFRIGVVTLGGDVFTWQVEYAFVALGRLISGVLLATTLIEYIATRPHGLSRVVMGMVALGTLIALLGLTAVQWNIKSEPLRFITDGIPRWWGFPGAERGFNANEIAGALAFVCPFLFAAGLALGRSTPRTRWMTACSVAAWIGFAISGLALFLGQSRPAIFGTLAVMTLVLLAMVRIPPRTRLMKIGMLVGLMLVATITMGELGVIVYGANSPNPDLAQRDEDSAGARIGIWSSALRIIAEYPLTGAGLNTYRNAAVRQQYPVLEMPTDAIIPHAHNEVLQIGADMGIPGMIGFVMLHATAFWMLWRVWNRGGAYHQWIALGTASAIAAHGLFALADAITLWDRFSWLSWVFLGIAGGLYVSLKYGKILPVHEK